jgi:hypothetical protein
MTIIIETVLATLASVTIAFLGYRVYSLKKSNEKLVMSFIQESADKEIIEQKLDQTVSMINNTNVEDKDGFIKFLSQSREWAFEYIENVQTAIKVLDEAMQSKDDEEINQSYQELLKFIPNDSLND